jgi:hypothetical protein
MCQKNIKILIANDELFQLEMNKLILKNNFNLEPMTALNGKLALETVEKNLASFALNKNL